MALFCHCFPGLLRYESFQECLFFHQFRMQVLNWSGEVELKNHKGAHNISKYSNSEKQFKYSEYSFTLIQSVWPLLECVQHKTSIHVSSAPIHQRESYLKVVAFSR